MNHLLAHLCRDLRHSKLIWFRENLVEEIFGLLIIAGFPYYRDTQSLLPGVFIITEFALLPGYPIVIAVLAFIVAEMFSHHKFRVFEFYPINREATGGDFSIFAFTVDTYFSPFPLSVLFVRDVQMEGPE